MRQILVRMFPVALLATVCAPAHADYARAVRNYNAVANGLIAFESLSAEEQKELYVLQNRIAKQQGEDKRSARQKCIDEEIERSDGSVTELERRSIDLKCSQR